MKKVVVILILLFLPLISAVEINVDNELKEGETFVTRISGVFSEPILKENVYFYRGNVDVPFEFKLLKIEEDYFIYSPTLGKVPANYSLVIEESEYLIEGAQTSSEDIVINFSIKEGFADFSVLPGVVIAEGSFSLEIKNLKDTPLTINVDKDPLPEEEEGFFSFFSGGESESPTEQSITLKAGETKQITLEFGDISNATFRTVQLSSGNFSTDIFVYVSYSGESQEPGTKRIRFETSLFNISMSTDSETSRILYLKNEGNTEFENVTIIISDSLKEYISIEPEFFEFFEKNKTKKINLNISSKASSETIEGTISAKTSDNIYAYLDISIEILEAFVPEGEVPTITKTCQELEGIICEKDQKCSADQIEARDNYCCLGECVEKKKSNTGRIIGWLVMIILVGVYAWFYIKKYKKVKNKVDLLKVAEGNKEV